MKVKKDHRPALVFGLVAATGAQLGPFTDVFCTLLKKYAYLPVQVKLTDLLREHVAEPGSLAWTNEAERIERLMTAGDELRQVMNSGDAMARLAAVQIASHRREHDGSAACAYVIRQLKHPEEVSALRRIYGDRFFLVALYSTLEERRGHLTGLKNISEDMASYLIKRDEEDEANDLGQRTRETFQLADVFVRLDGRDFKEAEAEALRFLDLIFGSPTLSPRRHEHAMYLAYAASLRSGDLSRQVGAAILSSDGDVIAVGCNDVPCPGGGQYWPGPSDRRDHRRGEDSNHARKMEIIRDIFSRLNPDADQDGVAFETFVQGLEGSLLLDITEYGRPVHAEMEAILACARSGVSTRGGTLFSTTFPCHNCAKHIVGAGIREIHYVEPYPKSLASPLHGDAIAFEDEPAHLDPSYRPVTLKHYVGIGARRYLDLFSMTLGSGHRIRRKEKGKLREWQRAEAEPRVPSERSAVDLEAVAIAELDERLRSDDEN